MCDQPIKSWHNRRELVNLGYKAARLLKNHARFQRKLNGTTREDSLKDKYVAVFGNAAVEAMKRVIDMGRTFEESLKGRYGVVAWLKKTFGDDETLNLRTAHLTFEEVQNDSEVKRRLFDKYKTKLTLIKLGHCWFWPS